MNNSAACGARGLSRKTGTEQRARRACALRPRADLPVDHVAAASYGHLDKFLSERRRLAIAEGLLADESLRAIGRQARNVANSAERATDSTSPRTKEGSRDGVLRAEFGTLSLAVAGRDDPATRHTLVLAGRRARALRAHSVPKGGVMWRLAAARCGTKEHAEEPVSPCTSQSSSADNAEAGGPIPGSPTYKVRERGRSARTADTKGPERDREQGRTGRAARSRGKAGRGRRRTGRPRGEARRTGRALGGADRLAGGTESVERQVDTGDRPRAAVGVAVASPVPAVLLLFDTAHLALPPRVARALVRQDAPRRELIRGGSFGLARRIAPGKHLSGGRLCGREHPRTRPLVVRRGTGLTSTRYRSPQPLCEAHVHQVRRTADVPGPLATAHCTAPPSGALPGCARFVLRPRLLGFAGNGAGPT